MEITKKPEAFKFAFVPPKFVFENINKKEFFFLDVRPDVNEYFKAHIPGAVYLHEAVFRAPFRGVPVQYLPLETLAKLFVKAGLAWNRKVVIYSDFDNVLGATMVAYILLKLGYPEVMVLDGGFTAYKMFYPVTQEYPKYEETKFDFFENKEIFVPLDWVRKNLYNHEVRFIDARPKTAFLGETTTWIRNGHIPGAVNIDWHILMDSINPHLLRPLEELKDIFFKQFNLKKADDIILYCGTSREASLEFFVMQYLLGFEKVRLYEGSWTEYCAYPELPVETTMTVAAK